MKDGNVVLSNTSYGCYLLTHEDDRDVLFQVDYDFPCLASHLGWSVSSVQKNTVEWEVWDRKYFTDSETQEVVYGGSKTQCKERLAYLTDYVHEGVGLDADRYYITPVESHPDYCSHDGTDGTIDCEACGMKTMDFIQSAQEWLNDNDGNTFDDPGYF